MTSTRRRVGVVVAWAAAATVGLAAVTGAAASIASAEATPSPSTSASEKSDKTDRPGKPVRRALAKRVLHGEAVVRKKDGGFATVVHQRGEVTAVDAGSVTLKSADGYTATYTVNGDTRVRVDGKKSAISGVKVGQNAVVVGTKDGSTVTARGVVVRAKD